MIGFHGTEREVIKPLTLREVIRSAKHTSFDLFCHCPFVMGVFLSQMDPSEQSVKKINYKRPRLRGPCGWGIRTHQFRVVPMISGWGDLFESPNLTKSSARRPGGENPHRGYAPPGTVPCRGPSQRDFVKFVESH
jgi:hypothetical protein